MSTGDYPQSGSITVSSTGDCGWIEPTTAYTIDPKYLELYNWKSGDSLANKLDNMYVESLSKVKNNKKGDDDMRYLYEVFLVNPKNDSCFADKIIARSETSALMKTYHNSDYDGKIEFDDLKTSCRVLMEWKKEYPKTACE